VGSVIPFDFDSNAVRVVMQDGMPWFVAKDVCDVLEISNHNDAVSRLDEDERDGVGITDPIGRAQTATAVSESGLYSLIFRSRKPEAKRFRRWVTGEVLPSLRKHGRYGGRDATAPALPGAAFRLKPALRARIMESAVEVAKLKNGDEADVERLFEKYCSMVGTTPESAARARGLEGVELWMDTYLTATNAPEDKEPASVLYDRYRRWHRNDGTGIPLTMKAWGTCMRERYDWMKSGNIHYFVRYREDGH
jgi:Prophage antirepressor